MLLEGSRNMSPDLAKVGFAVLWKKGSERGFFEERFVLLCGWREKRVHFPAATASEVSVAKISKFRLGQVDERNSLVDIIRVPSCRVPHDA